MDSGNGSDKSTGGGRITLPIAAKLSKLNSNDNHNEEWYILELPHTYQIQQGERWCVVLHSASLYFDNLDCESQMVKILLRELKNSMFPASGSNILCVIPNTDEKKPESGCVYYESVLEVSNLIECNTLNTLSFQFVDDEGKLLKLTSRPSFIQLAIKTMEREEYHIQLSGKAIKDKSEITFNLPNHVNLSASGNWKLACSSVCIPPLASLDELSMKVTGEKSSQDFSFENVTDLEELRKEINEKIVRVLGKGNALLLLIGNKMLLKVYVKSKLHFSRKLALILGFKADIVQDGLSIAIESGTAISPESSPDINLKIQHPNLLLITCNIIDTIIFNKTYKPILKMLPIKTPDKMTFHETRRPIFLDIVPSTLSSLTMNFEDEEGYPIKFEQGKKITLCLTIIRT